MIQIVYLNDENSLTHHGIKGQKWGVRRFQNYDGTRIGARAGVGGGGGFSKKPRTNRNLRAAKASQRDADDLRKHGYTKEADAVQKVADKQRAKGEAKLTTRKDTVKKLAKREKDLLNKRNDAVTKFWEEVNKLGGYDGEGPNSKKASQIAKNKELHDEHEKAVKDFCKAFNTLQYEDIDQEILDLGSEYYNSLTVNEKTWYGSNKLDKNGYPKRKYKNPNIDYDISYDEYGHQIITTKLKNRR